MTDAEKAVEGEKAQLQHLAVLLARIDRAERQKNYTARNIMVYKALLVALEIGYPSGVRVDLAEPEWPVLYIQLPTGQVSWHMPEFPTPWDGHTMEVKYARCRAFIRRELGTL